MLNDMHMDRGTYTIVKAASAGIGGIMKLPPDGAGAPSHWVTYVNNPIVA
jgi:predicted enzyme related to lactoylglutathione lyase